MTIQILIKNDPFVSTNEAAVNNVDVSTEDEIEPEYSSDSEDYGGEVYYTNRRNNETGDRRRTSSEKPSFQRDSRPRFTQNRYKNTSTDTRT